MKVRFWNGAVCAIGVFCRIFNRHQSRRIDNFAHSGAEKLGSAFSLALVSADSFLKEGTDVLMFCHAKQHHAIWDIVLGAFCLCVEAFTDVSFLVSCWESFRSGW